MANGYKFTQTSKEYIVSGVDSYVTSAADISADNLDSMKNEATDALDAYFANNNSYIGNSVMKVLIIWLQKTVIHGVIRPSFIWYFQQL